MTHLSPKENEDASQLKGKTGIRRLINAFTYSWSGCVETFKTEDAFRMVLLMNIVLIVIAFCLEVSRFEKALMIAVVLLSIVVELLNSAIEAVVDRVSMELHPLSKKAKDAGSAAQLFSLIMIAAVWAIILI